VFSAAVRLAPGRRPFFAGRVVVQASLPTVTLQVTARGRLEACTTAAQAREHTIAPQPSLQPLCAAAHGTVPGFSGIARAEALALKLLGVF